MTSAISLPSRPISVIASLAIRRTRSSKSVMVRRINKKPAIAGGLLRSSVRCLLRGGLQAQLIERRRQLLSDLLRSAAFDGPALEHLHPFAVAQQRVGRRRRAVADEVLAGALRCLAVVAGEDG